jgi:hypothetical protein
VWPYSFGLNPGSYVTIIFITNLFSLSIFLGSKLNIDNRETMSNCMNATEIKIKPSVSINSDYPEKHLTFNDKTAKIGMFKCYYFILFMIIFIILKYSFYF